MPKPDLDSLRQMLADKAVENNRSLAACEPDASEDPLSSHGAKSKTGPVALRNKALQYLARRDYARAELYQKLLPIAENPADIDLLLDDFSTRGWLSDSRFAMQWAHQRGNRYGTRRLRQELRQKGVADETIAAALEEIAQSEESRARAVWQKKFGSPPVDNREKVRQLRFLAARGFPLAVIYKVIGTCEDCDE